MLGYAQRVIHLVRNFAFSSNYVSSNDECNDCRNFIKT